MAVNSVSDESNSNLLVNVTNLDDRSSRKDGSPDRSSSLESLKSSQNEAKSNNFKMAGKILCFQSEQQRFFKQEYLPKPKPKPQYQAGAQYLKYAALETKSSQISSMGILNSDPCRGSNFKAITERSSVVGRQEQNIASSGSNAPSKLISGKTSSLSGLDHDDI